ncbi:uncharacterized protein LOC125459639 isoform X2 [Stegostoma tigrinum]|nr:uncharacterized protein LOC125459639 isoform X2 [Stegostoma tigrinum]XP_048402208.1 uncharacterized protein LOC125459639 isoform X2 [Stegostoma tigrinum]XP_048402210.1 uncharacterized protein LOC125459639 isoform X2 [Stegostoma tigrinum]XP_048402212.1 uncharacterized protein LOC125459639 isoform X2 [Stegostoma tigrinum]XP_059507660.1 uncharacterized protein LOC125459639 isoform X2 [Stegostoma tigrinum]XP_059507661.1 uncharacterized protein LOC125459639 isoform X2 [Stegostoma tigrinum]XP_05
MDPPTACVPWCSPPDIQGRQNMPSNIDLEQNVIFSDICALDEININKSIKRNAFGTRIQIKEVPIPQMYQKALHKVPGSLGAKGMRTVVVSSARSNATDQGLTILGKQKNGFAPGQQSPFSQQMNHLQERQRMIEQSKALKKIMQIVPHRVDRLYYICGSHMPIQPRYEVDMTALKRLQMKKPSQEATTSQKGDKELMCDDSEENDPVSNFEAQVIDLERQDKKCLVFMTENVEESQKDAKGEIQQFNGGSLRSVEEDENTEEHPSSPGEESPGTTMSPEC